MGPIALLAGLLLLLYGAALLGGQQMAASRPSRRRSPAYAVGCLLGGAAGVTAGLWLMLG
jgi:hypothetical protein